MINVKIKKLNSNAIMPIAASDMAAGYDLHACISRTAEIKPHSSVIVPTGLAIEMPSDYWAGIFARSGLAAKHAIRPANCVGIIDPDYRGEIRVCLTNDGSVPFKVHPGDRIAQMAFIPRVQATFEETDNLSYSGRGEFGFGSTGLEVLK